MALQQSDGERRGGTMQALVDQIYECAFVPDAWEKLLVDMASELGAHSAAMLVIDQKLPPLWASTPNVAELLGAFSQSPEWYANKRVERMLRTDHAGFLRLIDFSTHEELLSDYPDATMARAHLSGQVGSVLPMPDGSLVLFTMERTGDMRAFDDTDLGRLDQIRRHLGRASMLSVRLHMQRAEASVSALAALGLPAAVVNASGAVMAVNPLFESHAKFLRPAAFGRLSLVRRETNQLFQEALTLAANEASVQSVPVPSDRHGEVPAVVHVLPLRRQARDVFDSGGVLVVVTSYRSDGDVPSDAVLRGLFDLTAAEAKLAGFLAAGQSLAEAAAQRGVSLPTARSQLAQIFRKTGTRQQSELVALLKGAHGIPPGAF